MTGLGGLRRRASCVVIVVWVAVAAGCADRAPAPTRPHDARSVIPSGPPGAIVPIETQPEMWPCGAEHPQPGRLIRHDPAARVAVWDVPIPVQVQVIAMADGRVHLSDGVGLDVAVEHATGSLTFTTRDHDSETPYPAQHRGGRFDDRTSRTLSSMGLDDELGRIADATWMDEDLIVLVVFPGSECA